MGNHIKPIPMNNQPTFEQELINRYKQRLRSLWTRPNPYYKKGEFPNEYQEINQKIKQLEKI